MERNRVTSSYLHAIGYTQETSVLQVEFRNGRIYQYDGVPQARYVDLMNAASKGKYFGTHIKDRYPCRKVH